MIHIKNITPISFPNHNFIFSTTHQISMFIHYRVLVGFSPRMHIYDIFQGNMRYLNWQFTWWNGMYTIMLTKAAILHRDYLPEFDKLVPLEMVTHIDAARNCEDIAMAYVVAKKVTFYITDEKLQCGVS